MCVSDLSAARGVICMASRRSPRPPRVLLCFFERSERNERDCGRRLETSGWTRGRKSAPVRSGRRADKIGGARAATGAPAAFEGVRRARPRGISASAAPLVRPSRTGSGGTAMIVTDKPAYYSLYLSRHTAVK